MKKMVAGLIAAATFASVAMGADVLSKNAVGFVSKTVTKGQLHALCLPFDEMGSQTDTIYFDTCEFASNAPSGSWVYFWDVTGQTWNGFNKGKSGVFNSKKSLSPGELFFFSSGKDGDIVISGEVPDGKQTAITMQTGGNITAVGNPYPTDFDLDSSSLVEAAERGSWVYFWDVAHQTWQGFNKGKSGGFNAGDVGKVGPGTGFFFKSKDNSSAVTTWKVDRPYAWPAAE